MATRTTYTATITVPVYASWRCEHCGEINFAAGVITCKRQESTSSLRTSKHNEAKVNVASRAYAEWMGEAYKIISDPNHNGSKMYNNLFFENTDCTKCGKKPRWNKNTKFLSLVVIVILAGLISGIVAFSTLTSVVAWLIFLSCIGFFVWGIAREEVYKKMMVILPKQYTPIIGSLNQELIEYASKHGGTIPTPDECIEYVQEHQKTLLEEEQHAAQKSDPINPVAATAKCMTPEYNYCRKCGAQLQADSSFCHKCGTEIIK